LLAGPSSYPREIDFAGLKNIADEVGALLFHRHCSCCRADRGRPPCQPPFRSPTFSHDLDAEDIMRTAPMARLSSPKSASAPPSTPAVYPGLQGPAASNMIAARAVQMEMITRPAFAQLMRDVVANAKAFRCGPGGGRHRALHRGARNSHHDHGLHRRRVGRSRNWSPGLGAYGVIGNAMRCAGGKAGEPRTAFPGSAALR